MRPIHTTEEQLWNLVQAGDQTAFSEIYRMHWAPLFNSAYTRLRDREQCKDIVQNVFTDLWNRRLQLTIRNLSAFLHTAVRFQVYKQVSKLPLTSFLYEELESSLIAPVKTDGPMLEKELFHLLELWIESLPEKRRKIFIMHYFDELPTSEIAAKLNISQKTVQNQLHSASIHIRTRFAQSLNFCMLIVLFSKVR